MNPELDGDRIFSGEAHVASVLRFEAALARAQAAVGVVSADDAAAVEGVCRIHVLDLDRAQRDAMHAGTVVVPILDQLRARLPDHARAALHRGATSQDAIDTALVLQMRDGLDALTHRLQECARATASLADRHRRTVMAGRTLLQHAVPITFGLKAARWLGAVARQIEMLRSVRARAVALQFGGAAGTLASLGDRGPEIARRLAAELDLPVPELPWHAERDRPASIVSALGVTAGVLAKIAGDVVLLSETEVAEVTEGTAEGKGVSSAMPQKRNPVDAISAIAAARLAIGVVPVVLSAMAQEHERGAGGWQTEWTAIPDAFRHTLRSAACVQRVLTGLDVDADRMRANLAAGSGMLMAESLATALGQRVGHAEARRAVHDLVARCARDGVAFASAAKADPRVRAALATDALERALDPMAYLGATEQLIDRALESWGRVRESSE